MADDFKIGEALSTSYLVEAEMRGNNDDLRAQALDLLGACRSGQLKDSINNGAHWKCEANGTVLGAFPNGSQLSITPEVTQQTFGYDQKTAGLSLDKSVSAPALMVFRSETNKATFLQLRR